MAIWDEWYSVAEPLNKLTAWFTFVLSFLCWFLLPVQPNGYNAYLLATNAWRYVLCLFGGLFYFLILQEKVEIRNLDKPTHIWLWICFVLSWFTVAGAFIWVQFIMVCILSDRPFWKVFHEQYSYY